MYTLDEPAVVAMRIVSVVEHVFACAVFEALFTTDLCFHRVPERLGVQLSLSVVCTCDHKGNVRGAGSFELALETSPVSFVPTVPEKVLVPADFPGFDTKHRSANVLARHVQRLRRLLSHDLHFFYRNHYLCLHVQLVAQTCVQTCSHYVAVRAGHKPVGIYAPSLKHYSGFWSVECK